MKELILRIKFQRCHYLEATNSETPGWLDCLYENKAKKKKERKRRISEMSLSGSKQFRNTQMIRLYENKAKKKKKQFLSKRQCWGNKWSTRPVD
jgi:hypothetical protein